MKIFRRSSKHAKQNSQAVNPTSHSMIVNDANARDFLNESETLAHIQGEELTYADLVKKNKTLTEQNSHLNTYISQLVKENEVLQGRLSDMKVTLLENKTMLRDFMDSQNQAISPDSEVFGDKTTSVVNDAKQKEPHDNQAGDEQTAGKSGLPADQKDNKCDSSCDCKIQYEKQLKALEAQLSIMYDRLYQVAQTLQSSESSIVDEKKEDHMRWMLTG